MPANSTDLREMVYHTDARVTAMEGQVNSLVQSQNRAEGKLDHLISSMNQPKNVNWAAWVGVALTLLTMIVGGAIAMVEYVRLTQEPIIADLDSRWEIIQNIRMFQRETHYEVGVQHVTNEKVERDIGYQWDAIHKLEQLAHQQEQRLSALEQRVADIKDIQNNFSRDVVRNMPR